MVSVVNYVRLMNHRALPLKPVIQYVLIKKKNSVNLKKRKKIRQIKKY